MKIFQICTILILIISINAQQNSALLALSWFGGFCQWAKDCPPEAVKAWDHQSFTIHGYWPQQRSSYSYGDWKIENFNDEQLADMRNYWPPHSRKSQQSQYFLWEHEYENHGNDFAEIYLNQHQKQFEGKSIQEQNKQLQQIYFEYVIDLYQKLNVQKIPKNTYTKKQFAHLLNISVDQFSLICNQGTATLQQIRICYDITPSGSVIVKCKSVFDRNCKNGNVVLGEWRHSSPSSPVNKA